MKRKSMGFLLVLVACLSIGSFQCKSADEGKKIVAIATLMSHPALDSVQANLRLALDKEGFVEDKNIRYIVRNANGQIQIAASIANELASHNPDVIVAITTPMAQAVVNVARGPVVFSAVTDPVGAGLVVSLDRGEGMITGACDAWPYQGQLELIKAITPKVTRLGVLYNPGEAASQYGIKEIRRYAPEFGFDLVEAAVSSTSDVYPVAQNLSARVDALFLSSDNTVIGGIAAAVKVAAEHKLPLYVGDSGTVEKGGLAAVSVGYAALGRETGKLVARLLMGERNIPTFVGKDYEIYINTKAAELMGIKIPSDILQKATMVYREIKQ
jgi:putative tryptophan/tyrosine transport system substrate-binding protein